MRNALAVFVVGAPLAVLPLNAADTNAAPAFQEVYSLVRSNLAGLDERQLDRLALAGLLEQLQGKVSIVTNAPAAASTDPAAPLLSKTRVFEGAYAYLRAGRVEAGLAEQVQAAFKEANATNKLNGLVLDLRFAAGRDYAAAMAVADKFLSAEKALLNVGETTLRSTAKEDAIRLPVAVLVNQKTSGAAEALAAVLRRSNVALIIGVRTAGDVVLYREFPLSGGQRLRIASSSVRYAEGQALSAKGIKPDIAVEVSAAEETAYLDDPYKVLAGHQVQAAEEAGTNRVAPLVINEAELVRRHREGLNSDDPAAEAAKAEALTPKPLIRDPALSRAIDLLKGIAVVKQFH